MSTKADRGTKRVCSNCGARFYDLNRDPAICPSCQSVCRVDQPAPRRGGGAAKASPKPRVQEEEVVSPEASADEPETISLDEVEGETADAAAEGDEIEEIVDLGDDDADVADADDDTFLEEEEEGDPDVSGILKS